tara:strand:+ start:2400 stop:3449 length:1050 start_codon:yes stop_codon:yes gene_type:complete
MSKQKQKKKPKIDRATLQQQITDSFIKMLKEGTPPWERGWKMLGSHHNVMRPGRPYRGINQFVLPVMAGEKGFKSNQWGSFREWKTFGERYARKNKLYQTDDDGEIKRGKDGKPLLQYFGIKRGEKADCYVVYWKLINVDKKKNGEVVLDADGKPEKQRIPILKWFWVFNREQTNLPPQEELDVGEGPEEDEREAAYMECLTGYMDREGIDYSEAGDRAYYNISSDKVVMPPRELFESSAYYTSTIAHECVHSTGHGSRLSRKMGGAFGCKQYAREELIAEMGAALLNARFGFAYETQNRSAAYFNNWIEVLGNDTKLLIVAGTQAQKAIDLIDPPEEEEGEKDDSSQD